jgi:hypothetical protein
MIRLSSMYLRVIAGLLLGCCFSTTTSAQTRGIWLDPSELAGLPTSGTAWQNVLQAASQNCGTPDLANQDDATNVCVMAKALVYARTGQVNQRINVVDAIWSIVNSGSYSGRALALGRELGTYAIAADLIDLRGYDAALDDRFRSTLRTLLTTPTSSGPSNLIDCHESRPNNWGTHCGGTRAAVAAYLGDTAQLARTAQVFKGWLGDRAAYAGFDYGDLSWQCNASQPVGINPAGCTKNGHSIDGVVPDDQRRGGGFTWPPTKENYVYEALQGALAQAVILQRFGYDTFAWQDRALLRAFRWLHAEANYPPSSDDSWQSFLINYFYADNRFPTPSASSPGKNVGWTDWTHSGTAGSTPPPPEPTRTISASPTQLSFSMNIGGSAPASQSVNIDSDGPWTAAASDSRWIVSPASGSGDGTISVKPAVAGIVEGTYSGKITITSSGATGSPVTVGLSLSVAGSTAQLSRLSVASAQLTGGTSTSGTVGLSSAAGAGGAVVALSSSSSAVTVPASVTIPAGQTGATFAINSSAVTAQQQAVITATFKSSLTVSVTVAPAATTPPPTTPPPTGPTTGARLAAEADAYVRGGSNASRNYGSAATLDVKDGNDSSNDRRSFLRFNLGDRSSIASATLNLYVSVLDGPSPVCVHVAPSSWNESSMTYSNAPGAGAQVSCRTITATGWTTFDLTAAARQAAAGNKLVSIVLQDVTTGNELVRFSSRDSGANAPALEVK